MASHIVKADVQQWLSETKTPVPSVLPTETVKHAEAKIFGKLHAVYDTSAWTDKASTPDTVVSLLSMEVAARLWLKTYPTPANEEDSYGRWLLKRVDQLLEDIVKGDLELIGEETQTPVYKRPSFWPNDDATNLYDEEGDVDGAAPRYFTMGKAF